MVSRRSTFRVVFRNRADARRAVQNLRAAGLNDDRIRYGAPSTESDVERVQDAGTVVETGTTRGEGVATGMLAGAGVGVLAATVATSLIPGFDLIIARDIPTVLESTLAGAAAGGLFATLVQSTAPEEEARYYEGELRRGSILVTIESEDHNDGAPTVLTRNAAYDLKRRRAA